MSWIAWSLIYLLSLNPVYIIQIEAFVRSNISDCKPLNNIVNLRSLSYDDKEIFGQYSHRKSTSVLARRK